MKTFIHFTLEKGDDYQKEVDKAIVRFLDRTGKVATYVKVPKGVEIKFDGIIEFGEKGVLEAGICT